MPFQAEERAGVLWLMLNTPGAAVNIFNRATAAQTLVLMRSVDPRRVRAVVICSAKPASFINGAGVLLVTYLKTPEDVAAESLIYRQAYAAIRACPVPTVAAIEGNCWGCGLELALQCDHRHCVGQLRHVVPPHRDVRLRGGPAVRRHPVPARGGGDAAHR